MDSSRESSLPFPPSPNEFNMHTYILFFTFVVKRVNKETETVKGETANKAFPWRIRILLARSSYLVVGVVVIFLLFSSASFHSSVPRAAESSRSHTLIYVFAVFFFLLSSPKRAAQRASRVPGLRSSRSLPREPGIENMNIHGLRENGERQWVGGLFNSSSETGRKDVRETRGDGTLIPLASQNHVPNQTKDERSAST